MPVNLDNLKYVNQILKPFRDNTDLMAVTKNRSQQDVLVLYENGIRLFGENRVQEAQKKFINLPTEDYSLHLIGPLQTNKVKDALKLFNCIQTVDRLKLIDEISKFIHKDFVKTTSYFIQINIGNEEQKSGVLEDSLDSLYQHAQSKNLNVKGLMCIPPANQDPIPYFQRMNVVRDKLDSHLTLSMGMSTDYELALSYNTNLVRLGSILFND
jgi:pyridoxal phosphate enzyme (YggS family)